MTTPRTFFDKVWDEHAIADLGDGACLLQIDRLLLHDVTGGVIMREMGAAGYGPDSPPQVFSVIDHLLTTLPAPGRRDGWTPVAVQMIGESRAASQRLGLNLVDVGDPRQGITHVIAPELGIALPGLTIVCSDSHTCTLGGIGAVGWGIGTSEGTHVLATQTLVETKPKTMRVSFEGELPAAVTAKDMILALIGRLGAAGGSGHAVEFAGRTGARSHLRRRGRCDAAAGPARRGRGAAAARNRRAAPRRPAPAAGRLHGDPPGHADAVRSQRGGRGLSRCRRRRDEAIGLRAGRACAPRHRRCAGRALMLHFGGGLPDVGGAKVTQKSQK
jgi:hypothetical protein